MLFSSTGSLRCVTFVRTIPGAQRPDRRSGIPSTIFSGYGGVPRNTHRQPPFLGTCIPLCTYQLDIIRIASLLTPSPRSSGTADMPPDTWATLLDMPPDTRFSRLVSWPTARIVPDSVVYSWLVFFPDLQRKHFVCLLIISRILSVWSQDGERNCRGAL